MISAVLGSEIADRYVDKNVISGKIKYTDVSVSGGYGYNWVFAKNWLFASSLSLALGYKHTTSDVDHTNFSFRDFSIKNMNIDGVGRFGIVWNNTKWYFGASTILHSYNYSKNNSPPIISLEASTYILALILIKNDVHEISAIIDNHIMPVFASLYTGRSEILAKRQYRGNRALKVVHD